MKYTLDDLYLFKQIVDFGGISNSARALQLPKSTIARRITALEQKMDTPLFHRTGRGLMLTNFGSELYVRCLGIAREAERVFEFAAASREHLSGSLHIVYPPTLGVLMIEHLAVKFALAQPDVRLHLEATTNLLDPRTLPADLLLYFSFDELPDVDFVAKRLMQSPWLLAANPRLLGDFPPSSPEDLKRYPRVSHGLKAQSTTWHLRCKNEIRAVDHPPVLISTQISALVHACRMGVGVAALPHALILTDLIEGRLVEVLPDWRPKPATLFAMYPSGRTLTAAARRFLNHLIDWFSHPECSRHYSAAHLF